MSWLLLVGVLAALLVLIGTSEGEGASAVLPTTHENRDLLTASAAPA